MKRVCDMFVGLGFESLAACMVQPPQKRRVSHLQVEINDFSIGPNRAQGSLVKGIRSTYHTCFRLS